MLTIIKKRKRNFKFNILNKVKSCLNKEIYINKERIYCKIFYNMLLLIKPKSKLYALLQKPAKVSKYYLQTIIDTINFNDIELLRNNKTLKYLYEFCFIVCFNYSFINKDNINYFQKLLDSIESSYYKGVLAEEINRNIFKSKIRRLKYTSNIPHCADLKSSKYFIEIKNHKKVKLLEIEKFCYDMLYQYIKTKKYKFGIFVHFFSNQGYYYFEQDNNGHHQLKISKSFNMTLRIPFLGIPFSDLYKIDEIINTIEIQKSHIDSLYGYKQLYIISKRFKNNLSDIIKNNKGQHKKNQLFKFILQDNISKFDLLMKKYKKLEKQSQKKDEEISYLKNILNNNKIVY